MDGMAWHGSSHQLESQRSMEALKDELAVEKESAESTIAPEKLTTTKGKSYGKMLCRKSGLTTLERKMTEQSCTAHMCSREWQIYTLCLLYLSQQATITKAMPNELWCCQHPKLGDVLWLGGPIGTGHC